jgi:hypothetical protein
LGSGAAISSNARRGENSTAPLLSFFDLSKEITNAQNSLNWFVTKRKMAKPIILIHICVCVLIQYTASKEASEVPEQRAVEASSSCDSGV